MRKIVVHMQTTLDNRIVNGAGMLSEPFPRGEQEQAYINDEFRAADTLVLSRVLYDAIVPWWDAVARGELPDDAPPASPAYTDFAAIQHAMPKVVFSRHMMAGPNLAVISGDLLAHLAELKRQAGGTILLAAGPNTLGPLADAPGLIDEYLVVVHPAVLADGPRMFDGLTRALALRTLSTTCVRRGLRHPPLRRQP